MENDILSGSFLKELLNYVLGIKIASQNFVDGERERVEEDHTNTSTSDQREFEGASMSHAINK